MFGGGPKPPPPPPPPANPPSYASATTGTPNMTTPAVYGGLGNSILTSPMGAPATGQIQRKSLLGQ